LEEGPVVPYSVVAKQTESGGNTPHMQLTPRQTLMTMAHVFQQELFPRVEEELGPLNRHLELLSAVLAIVPLGSAQGSRARLGRPAKDRLALAAAFLAKAILNLATTRDLIERLRAESGLRRLCGWRSAAKIPHESKFSRAFAEFAASQLPQQLHAAVIGLTQSGRLVGHIARDSTAIPVRERFPEEARTVNKQQQKERQKKKKKAVHQDSGKRTAGGQRQAKASERGTRIQRQQFLSLEAMLAELPRGCDIGVKTSSSGHPHYWRGYKLHLDVADGQIPVSVVLTSASVHDSQVAIPLMKMTAGRVEYLYELMDSAYDADQLLAYSRSKGHVPIVAPHPRRKTRKPSQVPKVYPPQLGQQLSWAQQERYKERTMVERVNGRLKDEFGASQVRVRGAAKVMAHLMFGVVALTVDQWLRIAKPSKET